MTVYVLRRLAQTLLVLAVTSLLVFGGLYLIGDPVEILVNPAADQIEKERASKALGLDKPIHEQYLSFVGRCVYRQPRQLVCLCAARARSDLRTDAGHARTGVSGDGDCRVARHSARPVRRVATSQCRRQSDHGRLDSRLSRCRLSGSG